MPINSKQKGKTGELELAHVLEGLFKDHQFVRSGQVSGLYTADVVEVDRNKSVVSNGLYIEAKRVEKLPLYAAVQKAVVGAKPGEIAAVFHRQNRQDWLVTIRLDDLPQFATNVYKLLDNNQ